MSTDISIEAVNLTHLDWTPQCDVLHGHKGEQTRCERPAVFVIEVTHCVPYRLFACRKGKQCVDCGGRCCDHALRCLPCYRRRGRSRSAA